MRSLPNVNGGIMRQRAIPLMLFLHCGMDALGIFAFPHLQRVVNILRPLPFFSFSDISEYFLAWLNLWRLFMI